MPLVRFVPVAVNVKAGPPTRVEVGFRLVRVGRLAETVKIAGADRLPPGFCTTTSISPGVAIMADVIGAVRVVELTNVVTSGVPPNKICELAGGAALLTKSAPVTVRVKPGALGAAAGGFREELEC